MSRHLAVRVRDCHTEPEGDAHRKVCVCACVCVRVRAHTQTNFREVRDSGSCPLPLTNSQLFSVLRVTRTVDIYLLRFVLFIVV